MGSRFEKYRALEPLLGDVFDFDMVFSWLDDDEDHYQNPEKYERERYSTPGGRKVLEQQASNFAEGLEELDAEQGETVMELGAGTGLLSETLSDSFKVVSVDASRPMTEYMRENSRSENIVQADATRLGFKDNAVDYIVVPRLFHLLDDEAKETMMAEADRVASEGFVFDYFRKESPRDIYNDEMPMDSSLTSHDEIEQLVEGYDVVYEKTDFLVPFGLPRAIDSEIAAGVYQELQDFGSAAARSYENLHEFGTSIRKLGDPDLEYRQPFGNTVGYRGIKSSS